MVSSCVPASHFESAGAELHAVDIEPLLGDRWVLGLAEMMNFPGVVSADPGCLEKLAAAGPRPIDGHCPGLGGRELCAYAASGVGSDHECTSLEEARQKLRMGLHIMIREGSQARNLEALLPLVTPATLDRFMFVTDDKDVDDLREQGQIDHMIRRAIALGMNPVHAIKIATINTARYFGLRQLGAVAPGRSASLAILEDLKNCRVTRVYRGGELVAADGAALDRHADKRKAPVLRSSVNVKWLEIEQFRIPAPANQPCAVHVIEVMEDRIDTARSVERIVPAGGALCADPSRDLAKLAVIERHQASGNTGLGFVHGFGFTGGAIASSVGHDSHNLVIAGTNDADMYAAAVHLVKIRGGFCAVRDGRVLADVPLPIAGLMSDAGADELSAQLRRLHAATADVAKKLRRPFMALAFLSLSVIGKLKLTDQGLIDVDRFERIDLIAQKAGG
jgi:adenine deaminase